jgi:protein-S-isoprenylcysteine O-methyltransferase Ste14
LVLSVLGLFLRAAAAGSILKDQMLATGGVYSRLRHPLYVGSFLVGGGLVVASGRWWLAPLFLVGFLALYGAVVRREEKHLEREFGDPFLRYRDRVPAVLPRMGVGGSLRGVPGFRLPVYLRNKEWEAAVGVLAGFLLLFLKMTFMG